MALLKNKNFAYSALAGNLLIGGTSITITTGHGTRFPATGNFMAVLWAAASASPGLDVNREIVLATLTSGDTFSITRAQEGTVAKAWSTSDNFALVFTAGKMDEIETILQNRNISYIAATGTNNYTCTFDPAVTAYVNGSNYNTVFTNASTGSVTLAVNSLAAKKVYGLSGTSYIQLTSDSIPAGFYANLIYDSSLDGSAGGWICTNIDAAVLAGVKTFALSPIVPTPTTNMQASTKKYADDGLATKQATITGGATTITSSNLTASRALSSDASGKVAVATTTLIELNYVAGVTSAIQTQLDTKTGITISATVATTSGSAIDITSIPSTAKRITLNFKGVGTDGTSNLLIQIGDSGGVETTGYVSAGSRFDTSTIASVNSNSGFIIRKTSSASVVANGSLALNLMEVSTNTWNLSGSLCENTDVVCTTVGTKALSSTLDRIRLTSVGGAIFDEGQIQVTVE